MQTTAIRAQPSLREESILAGTHNISQYLHQILKKKYVSASPQLKTSNRKQILILQKTDNRSRKNQHCVSNVLVDIQSTIVMLRGSNNMVFRVRVGSEDLKRYKGTLPRLSRNVRINQTQPGLCWQKVKDDIDDITNYRGAGMVFLS